MTAVSRIFYEDITIVAYVRGGGAPQICMHAAVQCPPSLAFTCVWSNGAAGVHNGDFHDTLIGGGLL